MLSALARLRYARAESWTAARLPSLLTFAAAAAASNQVATAVGLPPMGASGSDEATP